MLHLAARALACSAGFVCILCGALGFKRTMKCWICGGEANSGEHMIKAFDLKSIFGHVSQKSPLFFHTDAERNQVVPSIKKSDKLKFASLICPRCNNQRTQRHDYAWEHLSAHLRGMQPPIRKGMIVCLEKVFPGSVRQSMLDVHLFFLKLFGCLITEYSIPLDVQQFSQSILCGVAHPKVHLAFWAVPDHCHSIEAGQLPVKTEQLSGRIVFAYWFYFVGPLAVNIMFAEPTERRSGLVHAWHPSNITKRVRITGL